MTSATTPSMFGDDPHLNEARDEDAQPMAAALLAERSATSKPASRPVAVAMFDTGLMGEGFLLSDGGTLPAS